VSPEASLSTRVSRALWAQAPRLVASLIIAGGFVWLFRRGGLPLIPPRSAFQKLTVWAIPSYALLIAIGVWFRAHRWVYLLRPIAPEASARRVVGVCFVGIAAILFAPLRLGEAARPYLLARDGKVSFFQGLGAAGAERVVDGLVLMLVSAVAMTLATPLSPLPKRLGDMPVPVSAVPHAIYIALLVFASAFAALIVFYGAREVAHRFTHRLLDPLSIRLANFVTDTLERLADGLKVLASPHDRVRFFGETLLYWACTFLATWVLMRGSGMPGSLPEACVSLGVLGLGAVIPAGPGFFGTYQIATYTGLALFFEQDTVLSAGAAMVFVSYATQLVLTLLVGVLGLWILGRAERAAQPSNDEPLAHGAAEEATRSSNRF
jgi:uncharacterized protein (TIRG00374 family)